MKKITGILILTALAVGLVIFVSIGIGFWKAMGIIFISILITALFILGLYLIFDR